MRALRLGNADQEERMICLCLRNGGERFCECVTVLLQCGQSFFLCWHVSSSPLLFQYNTLIRDCTISNIAQWCLYIAPSSCLPQSIKWCAMTCGPGRPRMPTIMR